VLFPKKFLGKVLEKFRKSSKDGLEIFRIGNAKQGDQMS
jgi:hypothetical protein